MKLVIPLLAPLILSASTGSVSKKKGYTKSGFTLIEVMITLAISALMLTALYQILYQATHLTRRTDEGVDYGTMLALMHNQLEKDISAAFYPAPEPEKPAAQQKPGQPSVKEAPKAPAKEKKDEKFFVGAQGKKDSPMLLTCITTTRLKVYGEEKPSLARVVYNFVPDKKNEQSGVFNLTRQESPKLDLKLFKDTTQASHKASPGLGGKIRAYAIAESLKKITFKYLVLPTKKEPADPSTSSQPLREATAGTSGRAVGGEDKLESFDVWNEDIQKKTKRTMPDFVEINGAFWDAAKKRELPFSFKIPIVALYKEKDEKKEKIEQAPNIQVPEQQKPVQQAPLQIAQKGPAQQIIPQEMTLNIVPKEQLALKVLPGENVHVNLLPHQQIKISFMPDGGMEILA